MAFVYEEMGEEGVELIKSLNLPTPAGCGSGVYFDNYPSWPESEWVIDREKQLYFFEMCGRGSQKDEPPIYCCLVWGKTPIRLDAYRSGKGDYQVGVEITWEVVNIYAPKELMDLSKEEIVSTIKEAFIAHAHEDNLNIKGVDFPNMATPRFCDSEEVWTLG